MSNESPTSKLYVYLNERRIGAFARNSYNVLSFMYEEKWLSDSENSIPLSLSLPLSQGKYSGDVVYNFLENLLPENAQLRHQLAMNVNIRATDSYSLLKKIGRDCVGALRFTANKEREVTDRLYGRKPITNKEIGDLIRNLDVVPLGINLSENKEFRISLAGFQNKTALLWDKEWFIPIGETPTTHILKPKIGGERNRLDLSLSVPNEHFCLTLCREIGLSVANSKISDFDGESVLVVERFDRRVLENGDIVRLPQEDLCQALALSPDYKYNEEMGAGILNCLELLNGSIHPIQDQLTFLKAQIVFWMIGATDGHVKNFSIFHLPKNQYHLTPLYDVLSLLPNVAIGNLERKLLRMAMAVGKQQEKELEKITITHFIESAREARVSINRLTSMIEDLDSIAESAFERAVNAMPKNFPADIYEPIGENIRNRAI